MLAICTFRGSESNTSDFLECETLPIEGEVGGYEGELGGFLYEMLRKERFFIEACTYTYLEIT